ncbi:MAG: aspartate/glutamate racemase family protein [Pseudomonadota bacterium]
MKTIGLLGGMSWESTALYYSLINNGVKEKLGGLHSAKIAMYSVNFDEIEKLQHAGDWDAAAVILCDAAKKIEAAGADFLLICTNTMHKLAPQVEAAIDIPLLHLADATALAIKQASFSHVGLLGTAFTMEQDFYKGRLIDNHDLDVIVPDSDDRAIVHRIIYDELCRGVVRDDSRDAYLRIIDKLKAQGAECVIEGCTEIVMLVQQQHTDIPLFDTTAIHAQAAVAMAIAS